MKGSCHYCGARATTQDHIVPKALGGVDASYNLVPACEPCNRAKGAEMPTCGCLKCVTAVSMPRRGDGQREIARAANALRAPKRRRKRDRSNRRYPRIRSNQWLDTPEIGDEW